MPLQHLAVRPAEQCAELAGQHPEFGIGLGQPGQLIEGYAHRLRELGGHGHRGQYGSDLVA